MRSPLSIGLVCSIGIGEERGGRGRNEDNYLVCRDGKVYWREEDHERTGDGDGEGVLLAVCDGMGGHTDGDVASTAAARVLAKLYRPGVPRDPSRTLMKYLQESHRRLHWKARDSGGPVTMGTTVTVAWILDGSASWCQVGDSRLYLFRDGQLTQITRDQTRNEFARRDKRGEQPDGDHLAQNFIFGSRGLGDDSALRMEAVLDCGTINLQRQDRLLLCTDGIHAAVDDVSLADVLQNTPDPQAAAVALMERAIARGSTDNITAMVVRVNKVPEPSLSTEFWQEQDEDTYMP